MMIETQMDPPIAEETEIGSIQMSTECRRLGTHLDWYRDSFADHQDKAIEERFDKKLDSVRDISGLARDHALDFGRDHDQWILSIRFMGQGKNSVGKQKS
jgi:hypothetical protein